MTVVEEEAVITNATGASSEGDSWPYKFVVLPVDALIVDEAYQRPLTTYARKIADNFDPALVGTLVVSERDEGSVAIIDGAEVQLPAGKYAAVDGQTRAAAARIRGVTELPCLVYMGLSRADEATLFARLQKERRGVASFHRFRASLVGGDPEALAIQRIVKEAGYNIGTKNEAEGLVISAVAALEKVYRQSPDLLERTLLVIVEAWADRHIPSGDTLRGVATFLAKNPTADDERLARRLSVSTPDELKRRALALRDGQPGKGADKYVAGAIEGIYKRKGN